MRWRRLAESAKRRSSYYLALYRHPRTPSLARWLVWAALGYLAWPLDIVPDFVPVLGHLDDVLIVGGLLALVLYLIPADVREECRKAALERGRDGG